MKIVWLPRAVEDREAQFDHIANENLAAALEQDARIERQVDMLARFPEMGRKGRVNRTRELVVGQTSLIVVYRVRLKIRRVEILRVLHGAQQWPPSGGTARPLV